MTEGIQRSGETRPHRSHTPESVLTDHPNGQDEEDLTEPRQSSATRPSSTAAGVLASPTRSLLKRPRWLVVAVVVLGIVTLVGGRYYSYMITHAWTDDAFIEGHVIQISPKVAGHVLQVYVADNQEVQQGALLLELDPR